MEASHHLALFPHYEDSIKIIWKGSIGLCFATFLLILIVQLLKIPVSISCTSK
jgi:hypothetical protein